MAQRVGYVKLYTSMTTALEGGEWSPERPGRTVPPGKTRYPFYRRLDGPQGRSGRAEKSRPHWDSIPDCPACIQSLDQLSYRLTIAEGAALFIDTQ